MLNWDNEPELRVRLIKCWKDVPEKTGDQIAAELGITLGQVKGEIKRLQGKGRVELRRAKRGEKKINLPQIINPPQITQKFPSHAEINQMRLERLEKTGRFDQLSREERGLPPIEIAREQHPNYPLGINRDAAHRIEHGRTQIFTLNERKNRNIVRQFLNIVGIFKNASTAVCPTIDDFNTLNETQKDIILLGLRKTLPDIIELAMRLERIRSPIDSIRPADNEQTILNKDPSNTPR